jgi:hypothetical protein
LHDRPRRRRHQIAKRIRRAHVIEVLYDVDLTAKRGEELSGGNIPIPIQPRAFLPARQAFKDAPLLRVVERVIRHRAVAKRVCFS